MTDKLYGWYSAKQEACCRAKITRRVGDLDFRPSKYTTPGGSVVVVTQVTKSPTNPENQWDDAVCLGEVVRWLGKVE